MRLALTGALPTLLALGLTAASSNASAAAPAADDEPEPEFIDPRKRPLPRPHRFRLGFAIDYIRLSAAVDADTGEVQRFHWTPLQLDFAYQARLWKYGMIRPSLAFGVNVANSLEAMPITLHPQLHAGFQGRLVGVALGYGYFQPLVNRKDARSQIRGGLGQPVIVHNHHVGGELSFTTRIHQRRESAPGAGELSIILRVAGVNSRTLHFDLDRRRWRAMMTFNLGWFFGDGRKARKRQQRRRAEAER